MRISIKTGVLLVVVLALGSCHWYGQPYLMFNWADEPATFFTDAPGVPSLVIRAEHYPTEIGRWTCEYYHPFPIVPDPLGTTRWIHFKITAHEGEPFDRGGDSLFEIFLYADRAPTFLQYYSATGDPGAHVPASSIANEEAPPAKAGYEAKTLGTFDQTSGAYRMTGTYGIWVPQE